MAAVVVGCGSAAPPEVAGPVDGVGLSPRKGPAVVWVGDRLFVFDGHLDPCRHAGFAGTVPRMAVTAHPQDRLTVDEFFALPGEQSHTQLIDGEIVVNAPSRRHQDIILWLATEFELFSRAHRHVGRPGLEMDLPVGDRNVYLPDLWWASPSRLPGPKRFDGTPDLAVEVRSPSTWRFDVGTKKRGYEAAGLGELWLVDTQADRVVVHRRSAPATPRFDVTFEVSAGDQLTTPILPGFTLDVAHLFDR